MFSVCLCISREAQMNCCLAVSTTVQTLLSLVRDISSVAFNYDFILCHNKPENILLKQMWMLCVIYWQLMEMTVKNWGWRTAWTARRLESFISGNSQMKFPRLRSLPWVCPLEKSPIFWCLKAKTRYVRSVNPSPCCGFVKFNSAAQNDCCHFGKLDEQGFAHPFVFSFWIHSIN